MLPIIALCAGTWAAPTADCGLRTNDSHREGHPRVGSWSAVRSPQSDTLTSEFEVAGVRVILRRNTANDVVAANLYLLGGTRQVTAADAGIEVLLLSAS